MSKMKKLIESGLSRDKAAELLVRSYTTADPVPQQKPFTYAAAVAHKIVTGKGQ